MIDPRIVPRPQIDSICMSMMKTRSQSGVSLIDTCYIFMTPSEEAMIYRSRYRTFVCVAF